jgi:hypothetical protein
MEGEEKAVKEGSTEDVVMAEGTEAGVAAGDLAELSISRYVSIPTEYESGLFRDQTFDIFGASG